MVPSPCFLAQSPLISDSDETVTFMLFPPPSRLIAIRCPGCLVVTTLKVRMRSKCGSLPSLPCTSLSVSTLTSTWSKFAAIIVCVIPSTRHMVRCETWSSTCDLHVPAPMSSPLTTPCDRWGKSARKCINTLRLQPNGHHFPDNIFKCILNWKCFNFH